MSELSLIERISEESLGFSLTPVHYKGKVLYFPVEVGRILGYENPTDTVKHLVNNGEFRDGEETISFKGEELAQLKALVKSLKVTGVPKSAETVDITSLEMSGWPLPDHLLPSKSNTYRMLTAEGVIGLTFTSRKPIGAAFRKWMRHVVIPSLMETGQYILGQESKPDSKFLLSEFESLLKIAQLMGLEGNQARLAAVSRIRKEYKVNLLEDMGIKLATEKQSLYLSPTEIGRLLGGVSARMVNIKLTTYGYQTNHRDKNGKLYYRLTEKGRANGLGKYFEDNKAHSDGTCQFIRWADDIVEELRPYF